MSDSVLDSYKNNTCDDRGVLIGVSVLKANFKKTINNNEDYSSCDYVRVTYTPEGVMEP